VINSTASVQFDVNPRHEEALTILRRWLVAQNYSFRAAGEVVAYVVREGTLAGSLIEPEDMALAEEMYVALLPDVPIDSDAWDRDQSVIFDVEMLAAGAHPWPLVQDVDDDRTEPDDLDVDAGSPPVPEMPDLRDPHAWPEGEGVPPGDLPSQGRPDRTDDEGQLYLDIALRHAALTRPEPQTSNGRVVAVLGLMMALASIPAVALRGLPVGVEPAYSDQDHEDHQRWLDQLYPAPPEDQPEPPSESWWAQTQDYLAARRDGEAWAS
jgi:hypothetical protein